MPREGHGVNSYDELAEETTWIVVPFRKAFIHVVVHEFMSGAAVSSSVRLDVSCMLAAFASGSSRELFWQMR